jgi:hypothetical protein
MTDRRKIKTLPQKFADALRRPVRDEPLVRYSAAKNVDALTSTSADRFRFGDDPMSMPTSTIKKG